MENQFEARYVKVKGKQSVEIVYHAIVRGLRRDGAEIVGVYDDAVKMVQGNNLYFVQRSEEDRGISIQKTKDYQDVIGKDLLGNRGRITLGSSGIEERIEEEVVA